MPVQARRIQIIVTRDLAAWLPRRQPSVDLGPLDVLACAAFSRHFYPTPTLPIYFGNRTWCSLPASAARGTHKNPNVKLPTRRDLLRGRLSVNYELIGKGSAWGDQTGSGPVEPGRDSDAAYGGRGASDFEPSQEMVQAVL
jgi:hypothetical protein